MGLFDQAFDKTYPLLQQGGGYREPGFSLPQQQSLDSAQSGLAGILEEQRIRSQNASPDSAGGTNTFSDIDELIKARTPQSLNLLNQGNEEQKRLQQLGTDAALQPLQAVDDMRAFEEQQAILGERGLEAQEFAIGNIPVSEFDRELASRQQKQLARGAAASGELGGGATLQAGQALAGGQQSQFIQNRLAQLSPLVNASRGIRSDIAGIIESDGVAQAALDSGLGTQLASTRIGAATPQIQGINRRAELSGLQGIASANQSASRNNQLAGLAGSLAQTFYPGG